MKRLYPRWIGFAWLIFVLVFVSLMFAASFFLTNFFYKIVNLNPALWQTQVINSLLGLIFTVLVASVVGNFVRARGWITEGKYVPANHRSIGADRQGRFQRPAGRRNW